MPIAPLLYRASLHEHPLGRLADADSRTGPARRWIRQLRRAIEERDRGRIHAWRKLRCEIGTRQHDFA